MMKKVPGDPAEEHFLFQNIKDSLSYASSKFYEAAYSVVQSVICREASRPVALHVLVTAVRFQALADS